MVPSWGNDPVFEDWDLSSSSFHVWGDSQNGRGASTFGDVTILLDKEGKDWEKDGKRRL